MFSESEANFKAPKLILKVYPNFKLLKNSTIFDPVGELTTFSEITMNRSVCSLYRPTVGVSYSGTSVTPLVRFAEDLVIVLTLFNLIPPTKIKLNDVG